MKMVSKIIKETKIEKPKEQKQEKPIVPIEPVKSNVVISNENPKIEQKVSPKEENPDSDDEETKSSKTKKRYNIDELLVNLNMDSLIEFCLKNPSLKHFNFLKYMLPDNYLPFKIDIPGLGSKTINKRGGGGFSGAVSITMELIKEVIKEKSEKKTQKRSE